jgi:hypothetical protein
MPISQYDKILVALLGLERIQQDTTPLKKKVMDMCQIKASGFAPVVSRMAKEGLVANGSAKGTLLLTETGRAPRPGSGRNGPAVVQRRSPRGHQGKVKGGENEKDC